MKDKRLPRVLCVDDEQRVLEGLERTLHGTFDVTMASSGAKALEIMRGEERFMVVLSDMRMPGMDGATFLSRARQIAPDAIRILLTGHTDFEAAMRAVNDGYVFRFLTKPCPPQALLHALEHAVVQYRLVTADRELLQQKLEEMSAQLLQAERLATLGTLSRGVGHELNNIIVVFMCLVGEIRRQASLGLPASEEDLIELERVGEHLKLHGRHLQNLGRPARRKAEREDLRQVVADVVRMLQTAGHLKHIDVEVSLPDEGVWVQVHPTRIEQVLVNLLVNAADATSEAKVREPRICVTAGADPSLGRAYCSIEDNGCGIPEDKLASVFEPYYSTKQGSNGTGLGLSVVKQIIASYDGKVSIFSDEGQGTTFTFDLPLADAPEQAEAVVSSATSVRIGGDPPALSDPQAARGA